jgi:hypothetical protein
VGPQGPVPFDRHEAALRNARETATTELRSKLGWAESLNQQEVTDAVNWMRSLRSDARGFYAQLGQELGVQEQAARGADDADPDPDLVSEDGRHKAYSATALAKIRENDRQKTINAVMSKLQPFLKTAESIEEQRQVAEITNQARQQAADVLRDARNLPHWKDHEPAILAKMQAIDPAVRNRIGSIAALYQAYHAVLQESVFPTIGLSAEQKVLADLQRKASAEHGHAVVNGGSNVGGTAKPRNVRELAQHLQHLESQSPA